MTDFLLVLTEILLGFLTLTGLLVVGIGVYAALFTDTTTKTKTTGKILMWVGYGGIGAGLLVLVLLVGHFVVWAVR